MEVTIMEKKSLLLNCPVCGHESDIKVHEDTVLLNFPFCCPKCHKETIVDIAYLKMVSKNTPKL